MRDDSFGCVFTECFTENVRFEQKLGSQLIEILEEELPFQAEGLASIKALRWEQNSRRKKKKKRQHY